MNFVIIPHSFFKCSTDELAKKLLGTYLRVETPCGIVIGRIIETESYTKDDPASHSFCGLTKRNAPMFERFGTAYVYFTYGMHHCFNIVANASGIGEAVLIRAVEPVQGIEIMKKNRGTNSEKNLTNGPAKLAVALGITKEHNGLDLLSRNSKIQLWSSDSVSEDIRIVKTTRIGITKGSELLKRFYIKGNSLVSQK